MTKVIVSQKQVVEIGKFMINYIGKEYSWNGKITHKQMMIFLKEKHIVLPKRVNFDDVSKESLLTGSHIAVKDEANQILIYENPRRYNLDNLLSELHTRENINKLRKVRTQILKSLGYKEAVNGIIKEEIEEDYRLEHSNRHNKFVYYKNNSQRKKHY